MAHRFKLNSNGNTARQIKDEYLAVHQAACDLIDKLAKLDAVHGRNYQTLEDGDAARTADVEDRDRMMRAVRDVSTWSYEGAETAHRQGERA